MVCTLVKEYIFNTTLLFSHPHSFDSYSHVLFSSSWSTISAVSITPLYFFPRHPSLYNIYEGPYCQVCHCTLHTAAAAE